MQLPEDLDVKDRNLVCKLHKSLYDLKQSARCWNERFNNFLIGLNFNQCNANVCILEKIKPGKFISHYM